MSFASCTTSLPLGPSRDRGTNFLIVKTFLWRQPSQSRYVIHLVNELSTNTVRDAQREDQVPVRLRIRWRGIRGVEGVDGGKGCRIRWAGQAWSVTHSEIAERLIPVARRCLGTNVPPRTRAGSPRPL